MTGRKSPTTYKKERRLEPFPLSPKQRQARRELEEYDGLWLWNRVADFQQRAFLNVSPDIAVDFMTRFADLASGPIRTNHVNLEKYNELRDEMVMRDSDVMVLARLLMQNRKQENKDLGKRLLFTLCANGHEEATIRILMHAILAEKTKKNTLRSSEIVYARGHLREIARSGTSYRAMVLEGKIAYQLGDHEYAIQMWTQAMEPAEAVAEAEREAKANRTPENIQALRRITEPDLVELSSPWVELTLIHYERYGALMQRLEYTAAQVEKEKARAAIEVGCAHDDPTSHYHAAVVLAETNDDGQTIYTSSWLYNMTKAAASGHVKAAHSLGQFYAESGWKYIEDEPPDHVKPTPFDSFPAESSNESPSLFSSILQLVGLSKAPQVHPSDNLFHTAIFPSTAGERWIMAIHWVLIATSYTYVPSFILAARISLQTSVWSQATVPPAALTLSPERYSYASKADYDAGRPISDQPELDSPDIPKNYRKDHARLFLRDVFWAAEAHRLRDKILARMRGTRRASGVDEDDIDVTMLPQDVPTRIRKWLYHQEVREQYEHEIWDLEKQAMQICDEHGLDIVDEDLSLIHI